MQTIEYKTKDRTNWLSGPWDNEPDKVQWQDIVTGLPCMIRRGFRGAWCGYVGVNKGHPAFEKGYNYVSVDVHGGLTYSNFCNSDADEASGICHVTDDHQPVWWLGFDCSHGGDLSPERLPIPSYCDDTYRDQAYVTHETLNLAKQLASMQIV